MSVYREADVFNLLFDSDDGLSLAEIVDDRHWGVGERSVRRSVLRLVDDGRIMKIGQQYHVKPEERSAPKEFVCEHCGSRLHISDGK